MVTLHRILKQKEMKNLKIVFWISTGLFSAFTLFSAYGYLTNEEMKGAFAFLGFSEDYFRITLAIAKILGAFALLLPFVPKTLKTFAYGAFMINIIFATIAHIAKDYHSYTFVVFAIVTLALSFYSYTKLQSNNANN